MKTQHLLLIVMAACGLAATLPAISQAQDIMSKTGDCRMIDGEEYCWFANPPAAGDGKSYRCRQLPNGVACVDTGLARAYTVPATDSNRLYDASLGASTDYVTFQNAMQYSPYAHQQLMLNYLFLAELGRTPTVGEICTFLDRSNAGRSYNDLSADLSNLMERRTTASIENRKKALPGQIQRLYAALLGRAATPEEVVRHVNDYNAGRINAFGLAETIRNTTEGQAYRLANPIDAAKVRVQGISCPSAVGRITPPTTEATLCPADGFACGDCFARTQANLGCLGATHKSVAQSWGLACMLKTFDEPTTNACVAKLGQAHQTAEAARVAAEVEAARVAAEVEAARVAAEVEAARVAAEVEAARVAAEEATNQTPSTTEVTNYSGDGGGDSGPAGPGTDVNSVADAQAAAAADAAAAAAAANTDSAASDPGGSQGTPGNESGNNSGDPNGSNP